MGEQNGTQEHTLDQAAKALHTMLMNGYIASIPPTIQQTRAFTALLAMGVMEFMQEQEEEEAAE